MLEFCRFHIEIDFCMFPKVISRTTAIGDLDVCGHAGNLSQDEKVSSFT